MTSWKRRLLFCLLSAALYCSTYWTTTPKPSQLKYFSLSLSFFPLSTADLLRVLLPFMWAFFWAVLHIIANYLWAWTCQALVILGYCFLIFLIFINLNEHTCFCLVWIRHQQKNVIFKKQEILVCVPTWASYPDTWSISDSLIKVDIFDYLLNKCCRSFWISLYQPLDNVMDQRALSTDHTVAAFYSFDGIITGRRQFLTDWVLEGDALWTFTSGTEAMGGYFCYPWRPSYACTWTQEWNN